MHPRADELLRAFAEIHHARGRNGRRPSRIRGCTGTRSGAPAVTGAESGRGAPSHAGATSYHAVRTSLGVLHPGSHALVISVGGLGGFAVQYISLLTKATIIAVDVAEQRRAYAEQRGAHTRWRPTAPRRTTSAS